MTLLPAATVKATVAAELPAAHAWAKRQGHELNYDAETLTLRVWLEGPDGERYLLLGMFEDYQTLPPAWRFVHPDTTEAIGSAAYPAPAQPYPRGSPLILDSGADGAVICAHFNRLAYTEEGGPHGDWGGLSNWQNTEGAGYTRATTIADMLARIALDVADSNGRKAPLP